jgi:hypothetical protein
MESRTEPSPVDVREFFPLLHPPEFRKRVSYNTLSHPERHRGHHRVPKGARDDRWEVLLCLIQEAGRITDRLLNLAGEFLGPGDLLTFYKVIESLPLQVLRRTVDDS